MSIDLTAPISEICERLGLEPRNVARLVIRPRAVIAEVYKLKDGEKYLEDGEPALETHRFEVQA